MRVEQRPTDSAQWEWEEQGYEELWASAAPPDPSLQHISLTDNSNEPGERIQNYTQGKCVCVYLTKIPEQKKAHFHSNIIQATCLVQGHLHMTGKKARGMCALGNELIGWIALQVFAVLLFVTVLSLVFECHCEIPAK